MAFLNRLGERLARLPFSGKFGRDVSWNYLSLIILGASGILMNVGIARFYGPETLGVFNLVFATYLILSQVAVFGVHLSVQKHVAQHSADPARASSIITPGLLLTAVVAAIVCVTAFALRGLYGRLFHSPDVARGLMWALPGLFCFALNKVLLAVVNGFRKMRAFAFSQALRYILLLVLLGVGILGGFPGTMLPAIFSGAEIGLLVWLLYYTRSIYTVAPPRVWSGWMARHAIFGSKALLGGVLIDANTKVDVLMLGYFCSARVVGIYSLAAIMIEGFCQLAVVVRVNVNPILARLAGDGLYNELRSVIRRVVKVFYMFMIPVGLAAVVAYPLFVRLLVRRPDFAESWPVFAILMAGLVIGAGYKPFDMLLVQLGCPGVHTLFICGTAGANIVLNILLIPVAGMYGAAVATGTAFILAMLFIKFLVWRSIRIRI